MALFGRSTSRPFDDNTVIRYLLGDLPEDDASKLEELYFCDRDFLAHVGAVESKLIGSADGLSGRDRDLFEKKYLAVPALRAKVESARRQAIKTKQARPEESSSGWRLLRAPAFAIPALTGVLVVSTLIYWSNYRQTQPRTSTTQTERSVPDAGGTLPNSIVAMTLPPGLFKGSQPEGHILRLLPTTGRVRLTLLTPSVHENVVLEAELLRVEESKRVSVRVVPGVRSGRSPSGWAADLTLDSTALNVGNYLVFLRAKSGSGGGLEQIETYAFEVERE